MKVNFEAFNREFFNNFSYDIQWYGRKGLIKFDNEKVIEITLETNGVRDNYDGYQVDVINKNTGKVTGWYFEFDEYLNERIDDRNEYQGKFHVTVDSYSAQNPRWYIQIPSSSDVDYMADKIYTFIETYK